MIGRQLLNQQTHPDMCTVDHRDERLYYPELMSGVIAPTSNVLSALTLLLMEDSGWYLANFAQSTTSTMGTGSGMQLC